MHGFPLPIEQQGTDPLRNEMAVIHACLKTLQTPIAIARHLQTDRARVGVILRRLVCVGAAVQLGHGCYAASSELPPPPVVRQRPQPIRDLLLAYLDEPRQACDIARHINRTVSITTGHLGQMMRLGQVVRVAYGVYQLREKCPSAPEPESITRGKPVEDQVRRIIDREKSFRQICEEAGRAPRAIRPHLQKLVRERGIERVGEDFFRPRSPDLFAAE